MDKLVIRGGGDLRPRGEVRMTGAKNAVLPSIAASLLTAEEIRLTNVPRVKDVETILTLIADLGGTITIVVPHFVPSARIHNFLHMQTAELLRRELLSTPGIVITEVPYQIP